jgi:hypothetical protein
MKDPAAPHHSHARGGTLQRGLLLALVTLLTGCADAPDADADAAAGGGLSQAENDLAVEYEAGDGAPMVSWSLTCADSVAGSHPDAEAACAHVAGLDDPFAPLPGDLACTEQYGGPQVAHVAGLWGGEPVDLELSRVDGCRISQWDALVPFLPAAQ